MINWYPGHMNKASKEINKMISDVDIIFLLCDARAPLSSLNLSFVTKTLKPVILLFNKVDLCDYKKTVEILKQYEKKGYTTLLIDSKTKKNLDKIVPICKNLLKDKLQRLEDKGILNRSIKSMVLGIPNTGKSTLINSLTSSSQMEAKNTPGVTRRLTWSKLNSNIFLLDTPGILLPKMDEIVGLTLSCIGSIKDQILEKDKILIFFFDYLKKYYFDRLKERYNVEDNDDYPMFLERVKTRYGFKSSLDIERIYAAVMKDLRNNNLRGITFDQEFTI
jgi:ribosome biogenesis GTPase A